jgi:hypothetical protein
MASMPCRAQNSTMAAMLAGEPRGEPDTLF